MSAAADLVTIAAGIASVGAAAAVVLGAARAVGYIRHISESVDALTEDVVRLATRLALAWGRIRKLEHWRDRGGAPPRGKG